MKEYFHGCLAPLTMHSHRQHLPTYKFCLLLQHIHIYAYLYTHVYIVRIHTTTYVHTNIYTNIRISQLTIHTNNGKIPFVESGEGFPYFCFRGISVAINK